MRSFVCRFDFGICSFADSNDLQNPLSQPLSPPGTLRDNLVYPSMVKEDGELVDPKQFSDEDLLAVLQQVDLPNLASRSGDGDPIRGLNTKLE